VSSVTFRGGSKLCITYSAVESRLSTHRFASKTSDCVWIVLLANVRFVYELFMESCALALMNQERLCGKLNYAWGILSGGKVQSCVEIKLNLREVHRGCGHP